jgi:hypothetical protein
MKSHWEAGRRFPWGKLTRNRSFVGQLHFVGDAKLGRWTCTTVNPCHRGKPGRFVCAWGSATCRLGRRGGGGGRVPVQPRRPAKGGVTQPHKRLATTKLLDTSSLSFILLPELPRRNHVLTGARRCFALVKCTCATHAGPLERAVAEARWRTAAVPLVPKTATRSTTTTWCTQASLRSSATVSPRGLVMPLTHKLLGSVLCAVFGRQRRRLTCWVGAVRATPRCPRHLVLLVRCSVP